MSDRRVVITGMGVIAPNGLGVEPFWNGLLKGESAIRPITRFNVSQYRSRIGGEVTDFDPADFISGRRTGLMGRFAQFSVASCRMAWEDSGLNNGNNHHPERIGVVTGTSIGDPNHVYARQYENFLKRGRRGIHFLASAEYSAHAATGHVTIELGLTGPSQTLSSGCSTGHEVLGWAFDAIRSGKLDVVLGSAADSVMAPFYFATLDVLNILSTRNHEPEKACRPYDRDREGSVASEGGGAFVVEELSHAVERGAKIYAEVLSCSGTSGAHDMVQPDPQGEAISRCIDHALKRANLNPRKIDYICSHGVAIPSEDIAETVAFKRSFGSRAYQIPVSSIKSMLGQPYAAGGAWQVITLCKALETGWIPPTINLEHPDPVCDLDYVAGNTRRNNIRYAMTNAQSVGETHSVVVMKRYEEKDYEEVPLFS